MRARRAAALVQALSTARDPSQRGAKFSRLRVPRRQALQPQHLYVKIIINAAQRVHVKVLEVDLRKVQRRRGVAVDGKDRPPRVVVLDEERQEVQLVRVVLKLAAEPL